MLRTQLDIKLFFVPSTFILQSLLLLTHPDLEGGPFLSKSLFHFFITSDAELFLGCFQLS